MSIPRMLVDWRFWASTLAVMVLGIGIDAWLGNYSVPLKIGTAGDLVVVVGLVILIMVWPKYRVWPGPQNGTEDD